MSRRALAATALASVAALTLVGCGGGYGDMSLMLAEQRYYEEVERPREAERIREQQEFEAEQERQARREEAFSPVDTLMPGECVDVTSIDGNWDNDVLCMDVDGSTFVTDFDGADAFLSSVTPPPPRPAPEPLDACADLSNLDEWLCEQDGELASGARPDCCPGDS